MGKIFDALKKSDKERRVTPSQKSGPRVVVDNRPESEKASGDAPQPFFEYKNVDDNLVSLLNPQSLEAEQFKQIKTILLFPVSGQPPRSIMVTSALPGEGKSFVSANLAVSIAQNIDEHVLLMDCDVRRPCIHSRFGYGDVQGLSDYLTGKASFSSLLLKPKLNKLSIFPAGIPPHNPAELLSSQRMANLLKEVKNRYSDRYVIIDSPPPHLTAETSVIAKQVDAVLLVIKYGSTKRELVEDLVNKIGKDKICGVIINWSNMSSSKYYGYGKYNKDNKYYGKF